jgi:hypothetical protein
MKAFFEKTIDFFHENGIQYMLSGSLAMSVYVLPRSTRDFDFVVHLREENIPALLAYFAEGYYCDADAVKEAVQKKGMFNIIDHASGYKSDFVVLKNTPFRQTEFNRRMKADFFGKTVFIVSPEDLVLSKLIWIQDYQSAVQMEDIKTLAAMEQIDRIYINDWIINLNLTTFNLL